MADVVDRDEIRRRVAQFFTDVIEQAGGPKAVAYELARLGYEGREGPYDDRSVRTWRTGTRAPAIDVLFALANRYAVSIDAHAHAEPELPGRVDRLTAQLVGLRERQDILAAWVMHMAEAQGLNLAPLLERVPEARARVDEILAQS